ncbi:MAG: saccharopine dehydrogenase NADP-binding domain-containing protein [Dehalococcoidia bacterium]|nr:saccharopine dehydrogenase NADP-binding domain-containing protein [Dehalococcoidia bacterium]
MKKVLVIGAGAQGGPCVSILARQEDVSKIVLGDIDIDLATRVKNKIKSDKVTVVRLNASKIREIEQASSGADVIINLTLCEFNENIIEAALNTGSHYVDAAGFFDSESQFEKTNNEFKKAGLTAFTCCGASPGITNVMARYACDKMNKVDEIRIRLCGRALEKPKEIVSGWEPTWSPEIALTDYADKPIVFENGEYKEYPPFSGSEEYPFPEPVGPASVAYHSHEEPLTLPRFIGKGIRYCDFKYPIDPIAGALVKMGFASYKPIDVKGNKVAPIHVLMKLVRQPVATFLSESEETAKLRATADAYSIVVEVKGASSGEKVTYTLSMPSMTAEQNAYLFKKFGTAEIMVALPSVIAAKMCVSGEAPNGVIAPECVDPARFFKIGADMGAPLKFHEVSSREISIS